MRNASGRPLLIFPGALGDLVCFLPTVDEIARRSRSRPALVCKGDLVGLVRALGVADPEPIEARPTSWLFSTSPPAEAADFFSSFSSIDCFTGSGVEAVAVNLRRWQGEGGRLHAFRPPDEVHLAVHFLRCVGTEARTPPEVRVAVPREALDAAREPFSTRSASRRLLAVHPGSGSPRKRWSRAGFASVIEGWTRSGGEAVVVLGPAERNEIADWSRGGTPCVSDLGLVELAASLALCDVYLGNDSGVSHLAAAVGARGAALFGPTDPACWQPLSSRVRVVRPEPWREFAEGATPESISSVERELRNAMKSRSP